MLGVGRERKARDEGPKYEEREEKMRWGGGEGVAWDGEG